ncbi:unnamed protein product [Durusdinium trenchii]|uniref:Uncharacterized protein n=1 Tax=Durusdinium trenchii TaxID=1381693 RepID=A0ABP0PK19_9DINO
MFSFVSETSEDRDVARQHARLDDLEHERREGQLLEEVLQDKVKRIEDLEAKVSSSAQSLLALQDDLAASRRAQDALDQERRLKLLETWRQEEVQQVFSRYDQKIESLTHRVATEELQKIFQPLTTEAKQLTEQVTMRVANLEEQVTQSQAGRGKRRVRLPGGRWKQFESEHK